MEGFFTIVHLNKIRNFLSHPYKCILNLKKGRIGWHCFDVLKKKTFWVQNFMHAVEAFSLGRDVHPQTACFLLLQTSPEEKVDNLCKSILLSACSLYKCIHSRIFYQLPVCSAVAICCETVFVWLDAQSFSHDFLLLLLL